MNERLDDIQLYAELLPGKKKDTKTLKLWGRIAEGLHIYSVFAQGEFAPMPTQVVVDNDLLKPLNRIKESQTVSVHDESFDQILAVHKQDFWIEQEYRILDSSKTIDPNSKGSLLYQVCSKKICSLPMTKSFTITVQ